MILRRTKSTGEVTPRSTSDREGSYQENPILPLGVDLDVGLSVASAAGGGVWVGAGELSDSVDVGSIDDSFRDKGGFGGAGAGGLGCFEGKGILLPLVAAAFAEPQGYNLGALSHGVSINGGAGGSGIVGAGGIGGSGPLDGQILHVDGSCVTPDKNYQEGENQALLDRLSCASAAGGDVIGDGAVGVGDGGLGDGVGDGGDFGGKVGFGGAGAGGNGGYGGAGVGVVGGNGGSGGFSVNGGSPSSLYTNPYDIKAYM
nr:uncharacterized protein LOC113816280 [Penaeus vannamei]